MTSADLLRAVVAAWDSWDDEGATRWEAAMRDAVEAARLYLAPLLVEDDPPAAPRCVP